MKNWSYHHPWRFAGLLLALAAAAPIAVAIDSAVNQAPDGKNLMIAAAPDTSCPTSAALEPISVTAETTATLAIASAKSDRSITTITGAIDGIANEGGAALGAEQTACVVNDLRATSSGTSVNGTTSNITLSSNAFSATVIATASSTAGSPITTVRFTNGPNFAGATNAPTNNRSLLDQEVNEIV